MGKIIKHKGKLFAFGDRESHIDGIQEIVVIKAQPLPDNKKLVEEIRSVMAFNEKEVEEMIRNDQFKDFKKLS